jgi:signal transduction histidine kinase
MELSQVNETLIAEVQERRAGEERIKKLLRQLVHAQEEERRKIARELHDTLGQQLAALHVSIEIISSKVDSEVSLKDDVERMRQIFNRLNSDVDFLAWELRPPLLDLLGLDAALESFVKEWSQQFGIAAAYQAVKMEGARFGPEGEINLYRIFQEALQNIHKHAGATHVNVLLERHDGQAVLVIEDNGKGYTAAHEAVGDDRGMGLTNMQERAALIGGEVEVETEAGAGTTIFVRVPLTQASLKEPG